MEVREEYDQQQSKTLIRIKPIERYMFIEVFSDCKLYVKHRVRFELSQLNLVLLHSKVIGIACGVLNKTKKKKTFKF